MSGIKYIAAEVKNNVLKVASLKWQALCILSLEM